LILVSRNRKGRMRIIVYQDQGIIIAALLIILVLTVLFLTLFLVKKNIHKIPNFCSTLSLLL